MRRRTKVKKWFHTITICICIALSCFSLLTFFIPSLFRKKGFPTIEIARLTTEALKTKVLSFPRIHQGPKFTFRRWTRAFLYAYVENPECANNFDFFMSHSHWELWNSSTLLVVVVNGNSASITVPNHLSFSIIFRKNEGFDFGAHAAGLEYVDERTANLSSSPPLQYGFLNCGVSGPFLPSYVADFDWFGAFSSRLSSSVRLVGAYLTCLPFADMGGHGPRIEGHSFFTDSEGVRFLRHVGVFQSHPNKLSAILDGEWAMTQAVFLAGGTVDTLLYRYQGVEWRLSNNSNCNSNRFVGRSGGYGGGDINPFETIFFKRLWRTVPSSSERSVRWKETARLMAWRYGWAIGSGASDTAENVFVSSIPPYTSDELESEIEERLFRNGKHLRTLEGGNARIQEK